MPPRLKPLDEELFKRIVIDDDGAWWTGALTSTGYPFFRRKRAHRLLYEMFVGPIPPGMDIDHDCHNQDATCRGGPECRHRRCMVTAHMVPRSRGDNVRRGRGPEQTRERQAARRVCRLGHELEALPGGQRGCRTCRRERGRKAMRDGYRAMVGIPLDAPLYVGGRPVRDQRTGSEG